MLTRDSPYPKVFMNCESYSLLLVILKRLFCLSVDYKFSDHLWLQKERSKQKWMHSWLASNSLYDNVVSS